LALADFGTFEVREIGNIRFHPKLALADFGTFEVREIGNIRFRGQPLRSVGSEMPLPFGRDPLQGSLPSATD
jgi:hypothetical protein